MEVRGKDRQHGEWKGGGGVTGRRGNHSIVSAEEKRYEYSNITLLIRDGCLFLWGKALLVFVSSLIICMMYSTALYSVMGGRWRSGRLTMRPKGCRSRHSQLCSMQSSKATLLYPKLVTISQSLKPPSNNSTKAIFWKDGHTEGEITILGQQLIANNEFILPATWEAGFYNAFWMTQESHIASFPGLLAWRKWLQLNPLGNITYQQPIMHFGIQIHPVDHIVNSAGAENLFQMGRQHLQHNQAICLLIWQKDFLLLIILCHFSIMKCTNFKSIFVCVLFYTYFGVVYIFRGKKKSNIKKTMKKNITCM